MKIRKYRKLQMRKGKLERTKISRSYSTLSIDCRSDLAEGGVSSRCRIEKKEENGERTQTRGHPSGFSRLEVFKKAATKKDDHNHPKSLQRGNYRIENI